VQKKRGFRLMRHFLNFADLSAAEHRRLLARAGALKAAAPRGGSLQNRVLLMFFQKSSTRTRVSFEAAMAQLGGHAIMFSPADSQIGRGESIEDTARAVSGMIDAAMLRTERHDTIVRFARASRAPVINGLSEQSHPCQVLADIMTFEELRGGIADKKVCWVGDANNMCRTWLEAAGVLGFDVSVAAPPDFAPKPADWEAAKGRATVCDSPANAAANADLISTDVWVSMGDEKEDAARKKAFAGFTVDAALMKRAKADAIFLHCLPAKRGEEVSAEVIDGEQSAVWRQAENRLHAQKALLEFLILGDEFDKEK
jgi:ornithine carbamoyltransferase